VRAEFEDIGAVFFGTEERSRRMGGSVLHQGVQAVAAKTFSVVRGRSNRDEQVLSIGGENDIAGPVSTAAQPPSGGNLRGDQLCRPPGLQIAVLIRKAHHGAGVRDIYISRIRTWRPERDTKRRVEPLGIDR